MAVAGWRAAELVPGACEPGHRPAGQAGQAGALQRALGGWVLRAAIGPGRAGCLLLTSRLVGRSWWVWHVTNVPGDLGCGGEHQLS